MKKLTLLLMIMASLLFASCSKQMIAGTKIEDTPTNHDILNVFYAYGKAMQEMDVLGLEALISKNYYDKNGTDIPTDDVDFDGVMQFLNSPEYKNLLRVQTTYILKDLQVKSPTHAVIFYFYELQAKRKSKLPTDESELAVAKGAEWMKASDEMVMTLKKEKDGKWLIVDGL